MIRSDKILLYNLRSSSKEKQHEAPINLEVETPEHSGEDVQWNHRQWFAVPKQVSFMEIASQVRPLEASDVFSRGFLTRELANMANMAKIMANYPLVN